MRARGAAFVLGCRVERFDQATCRPAADLRALGAAEQLANVLQVVHGNLYEGRALNGPNCRINSLASRISAAGASAPVLQV